MSVQPIFAPSILTSPEPKEPIPNLADQILSIPDYISPSHWMLIAFNEVFGFNPAEEAAKWFAGDWNGMAKAESAFKNLTEFQRSLAENIDASTAEMFSGWTGEAANAANSYFVHLNKALIEHAEAIDSLATQFHNTAYGVWSSCKAIVSGLEMLADILLGMALDLAATALLSETGVGLAVGAGIAAYLAFKAENTWMKVVDIHGKMIALMYGFSGIVAGQLSSLRGLTEVPIPAAPYDNKTVD